MPTTKSKDWQQGFTGNKVARLLQLGYEVFGCDPNSPTLNRLRKLYPNAIEERVLTPKEKILFCVIPAKNRKNPFQR